MIGLGAVSVGSSGEDSDAPRADEDAMMQRWAGEEERRRRRDRAAEGENGAGDTQGGYNPRETRSRITQLWNGQPNAGWFAGVWFARGDDDDGRAAAIGTVGNEWAAQ
jgi:hypothetical protein